MLGVLFKLLNVVNYLHQNKMVHRDIRIETVFVKQCYDEVFVQLHNLKNAFVVQNKDQRIYGYRSEGINYCAPETFRADLGYSEKVDEYAVGVVAYYMFTGGEFPYQIPSTIKKDERIYRFISKTCIDFK